MKRILFILLCFFFLTGSTIDTFEGQAVDTASTIEGTDAADTIEGQTLASSYNCSGSLDWGGGDVIESFERSAGNFCSDQDDGGDCQEDDGSNSVNTYNSAQSTHLSHSASITHDSETSTTEFIECLLNASGNRYFGMAYYPPNLATGYVFSGFISVRDTVDNQTVIAVSLADDADVQKLCFGADCSTDYFELTSGYWYYISIHAQKNDTCSLKVYKCDNAGTTCNGSYTQQNCTGSGDCSTNVIQSTGANEDVGELRLNDDYDDTTGIVSYWDEVENSASELSP